ncbi:HAD-IIIA family hydrolase [Candidatus Peribacteria bacterium]|nr:HAD-IIIA family hydrolase [Candidatus Peribacteria bacterium]
MHVAFLDRDGTLIHEPPDGLVRPEEFRVLSGVTEGLRALKAQGFTLVMITNQSFLGSSERQMCFEKTQEMLFSALKHAGLAFDFVFFCPHSEAEDCNCRKPKTGMVDEFLREHEINKARSFIVGDRESADGGLARAIGVRYLKMEPNGTFPLF